MTATLYIAVGCMVAGFLVLMVRQWIGIDDLKEGGGAE